MIYDIIIKDLADAESYAYGSKQEFDLWISLVDEEDRRKIQRMNKLFAKKRITHLVRYFYDWSDEDKDLFIQKNIEIMGPKIEDIQAIISFLTPYVQDDCVHRLGVNCFAGISRSTAVGIIAAVLSGKTPQNALEYILAIRPEAWPNLRILRLAEQIIGQEIVSPVKSWKRSQTSIYLP